MDSNPLSQENSLFLTLLRDMNEAAGDLRWYVWGGMTADILEGRFLREHGDFDGFIENLEQNVESLSAALTQKGYEAAYDEEFQILKITRGPVHAGFNPLRVNGAVAEWKHIGEQGSIYFPFDWMDSEPRDFLGAPVRIAGIRFEYMFRTNIPILNPRWKARPKDIDAVAYYRDALAREGIDPKELCRWFWTYNPFWYHRGYEAFFLPQFARPEESG